MMKGQALVESLFTYILIFLMTFCVIEIARLQSFKTLLQISVNYYAKYIALDEMRLIHDHQIDLDSNKIISKNTITENKIQTLIENDLSFLSTSLFSFDESTIQLLKNNVLVSIDLLTQQKSNSPPGIHIKAQTCLPVLFSSFFNLFLSSNKIDIGRSINDSSRERNCLGEFIRSQKTNSQNSIDKTPRFWFRVRAAGYSPWPSSTQIFYKGLGVPKKINLINSNQREKFVKKLDEVNFEEIL